MTTAELAARLNARQVRPGEWRARCPVHGGRSGTSLSVREGEQGRILVHCFSGCEVGEVCAAMEIHVADLFAEPGAPREPVPVAVREAAEGAAWRAADEIGRLRRYHTNALHRAEKLQARIGERMAGQSEAEREAGWNELARLASASTFFLAAWDCMWRFDAEALIRFALASSAGRRAAILGESGVRDAVAA